MRREFLGLGGEIVEFCPKFRKFLRKLRKGTRKEQGGCGKVVQASVNTDGNGSCGNGCKKLTGKNRKIPVFRRLELRQGKKSPLP
jgi:hypothetical protein